MAMAVLLRKVWGSVLARAAAGAAPPEAFAAAASPRRPQAAGEYGSLGALDVLPIDVLAQILRLLGPADAARSTAVCRAWRLLASDNGLWAFFLRLGPDPWELVVFAETHLGAGPALHPGSVLRTAAPLPLSRILQLLGLIVSLPNTIVVRL